MVVDNMTEKELKIELERIIEDEYPLIASIYIDEEIMLQAARKINYEVIEWRGISFPYRRLHEELMGLIKDQYLTTNIYNIKYVIGEEKVVGFLNKYYHWVFEEKGKMSEELANNNFNLSENDIKDFNEFERKQPVPCMDPLDIAGYLHMCRIMYDAAPMFVYPDFISDLHVVGSAKFDSCGLADRNMNEKMRFGDSYPEFMHYHPDEMGFGGPYVYFGWNEDGWIMTFVGKGKGYSEREVNMDIHRFLAMRRAGYPVLYHSRDY